MLVPLNNVKYLIVKQIQYKRLNCYIYRKSTFRILMLKECHCKIKFVSLVPNPFFKSSLLAFIMNMIGCRDNTHWKKINSWTSIHLFIRFMVSVDSLVSLCMSSDEDIFCLRTGIIQLPRFFTHAREWTEIITRII